MDIGVSLPLPADLLGDGASGVATFVDSVASLGYAHLSVHDHVIGTDPRRLVAPPSVRYTHESRFHEPLTFLSWVAARAPRLGLITTVLVSPQRQTALLAKQVAEVAVLSGGRLSVGLGAGVNPWEYRALGIDFHRRGRILDEQIPLLRRLWSGESVDAESREGGAYSLIGSAIAPAPASAIPILVGGASAAALHRAVAMADGVVLMTSDADVKPAVERVHAALDRAGRGRTGFRLHGFVEVVTGGPDEWASRLDTARRAGLTEVSVMTGHPAIGQLGSLEQHLARLCDVADRLRQG